MKVAVIGGGSSYTPELINGFLHRIGSFPLSELWLMDTQPQRLKIVGGFAQLMVAARGSPFRVHLTGDQNQAVRGARYVITQIRVGAMDARREDEYLGHRHGLIGQETTGVGGMASALRTIPVILDIARDMEGLAPGALLINFANPAGLVTEALARHAPQVPSVGVCNVPITAKMEFLERLERQGYADISPQRAELDTLGLNHLSWHRGLRLDGRDVWSQVVESYVAELEQEDGPEWDAHTIESTRMIPNYYLQYYYFTERMLAEQEGWPPSRAEQVMKIERRLLSRYADLKLTEPPEGLRERGGAYYSTMATQLLSAHYNDLGEGHVVNMPHRGAVAGWPEDWVLEMPCRVGSAGIEPIAAEPLAPACYDLLARVKAYEILTVQAAVHGDWDAALQALCTHPLGPTAAGAEAVLEDMLETNRAHLPQFWDEQDTQQADSDMRLGRVGS
jgi:6-phospho-beta-glucosidase